MKYSETVTTGTGDDLFRIGRILNAGKFNCKLGRRKKRWQEKLWGLKLRKFLIWLHDYLFLK